jgi:ABC-2 type transport system permease protein
MMIKYSSDVNEAVSEHTRELNEILTGEEIFMDMPDFPYRNEVINRFRAGVEAKTAKSLKPEIPEITHFRLAPVGFKEAPARQNYKRFRPNPLQNSIPAFTLFAMFFIVIPLAGSIINEKSHGTFDRMRILPVSIISIISARILLFIAVCFLQFVFLMIIGKYLMPLFGDLSSISMNVNVPALIAAFISSSLAAIGFGIAVGTFSTTHGQAATFGSVMVVILALLGGIFVPIHMLPATIISVSLVSPLRWGTDAFLGVFSQLEDLRGIWKEVCLLFSFFLLSLILSVAHFRKQ